MKNRILIILGTLLFASPLFSQNTNDTLPEETKNRILGGLKNFTLGFYIDAYVNMEFDENQDTSNIVPFAANCPFRDQIRLNVAAVELYYNADRIRGKLQLQYGDAPNLLAAPEKQWIKTIRQAAFGYQVAKGLWFDVGYMFTPVGMESAWPVTNWISTASICAYFEAGAVLGVKVSYKFSDKLDGGFMVGNPYSLAYQQTNHLAGVMFINYKPLNNLTLSYNNLFGNQALRNAEINNNLLYNDIAVCYDPFKNLGLIGQFDFAFQTNSKMAPDSTKTASMCSGFIQARYKFLDHFSVSGRYEYYYDPDGFLSGPYTYNEKTTGLTTNGMAISIEYKPIRFAYFRVEYKYLHANNGNLVFYGKTSDHMNAIIITTGVRF